MPGCVNLLNMYRRGDWITTNLTRAASLHAEACEGGDVVACTNLGNMYRTGGGVTQDLSRAASLHERACDGGEMRGCNNLGNMYDNGEGVPEDQVLAYMWWNLAAAQGNEGAQRNKGTLENQMTREQIAEAQRLSREWLEAHPPGGN